MDLSGIRRIATRLCTALILIGVGPANALTIDFEALSHGEVANGVYSGVTISASNPNQSTSYAVGFDSNASSTRDPDLEANPGDPRWSGGNIAGEDLSILLILQENSTGCSTGVCSSPDDEGDRPAGVLSFDFSISVQEFGFDFVDLEGLGPEHATIDFFGGGESASFDLAEYFDTASPLYDPSLQLGNNTANRFSPITAEFLGLSEIDHIDFNLGGSGALDNLQFTPVPEPSTALMIGLGLAFIGARRRGAVTQPL
jgi:hypothetical protein